MRTFLKPTLLLAALTLSCAAAQPPVAVPVPVNHAQLLEGEKDILARHPAARAVTFNEVLLAENAILGKEQALHNKVYQVRTRILELVHERPTMSPADYLEERAAITSTRDTVLQPLLDEIIALREDLFANVTATDPASFTSAESGHLHYLERGGLAIMEVVGEVTNDLMDLPKTGVPSQGAP